MMIGGGRVCGKTTELIKKASKDNLYIITVDRDRAGIIERMARELKLDIPFPITAAELPLRSPYINEVLVDDVEAVLRVLIGKTVLMSSTSMEMKQLESLR